MSRSNRTGSKVSETEDWRKRRIRAEDPDWSLELIPPLSHLCLQSIVRNFEEKPTFEEIPPSQKDYVLQRLSPSLSLHVTANLISQDVYWKRCCRQRWELCDVSCYGHSWKRMFFERHLENIIELFIPEVTDPKTVLDVVPLCKNSVKRLIISQLLPPVKESPNTPEESGIESEGDSDSEEPPLDHFDFSILLDKLTNLEELHVMYGIKQCGMNFEVGMFVMSDRDSKFLGKALKSCNSLKVLRLHQSQVEDEKCRQLVKHMLDHPSLMELDLSHNLIGDRGARAVGKLLNRSKLEILKLYDNNIRGSGAQALAHALTKNSTLLSLNLCLNRLGDEGGQAVGKALLKNKTLLYLHLGSNEMTESAAAVLSDALIQNNTLRSINLSCNRLSVDGGKALAEAMSQNSSITECDVRLSEVDEQSESSIEQAAQSNKWNARKKQTGDNKSK
ncbi:hypothetical protein LDENG_00184080 [Lucifuga dentata]|nr:hypothetical protein LDENG_00184080 [Lucifuga dentata]